MTGFDRPTISERYTRAVRSSHLEVKPTLGDVDLLIAEGWASDSLSAHLYRVRIEFDSVRSEHRKAERELEKAVVTEDTKRATTTALLLILMQMRTLGPAKQALGNYACGQATRQRYMEDDVTVSGIAGRALEAWIDPKCRTCDGRGYNGGFGGPQILCSACGGSSLRRYRLHQSPEGHDFGRWLLTAMDHKAERMGAMMLRFLSRRGE